MEVVANSRREQAPLDVERFPARESIRHRGVLFASLSHTEVHRDQNKSLTSCFKIPRKLPQMLFLRDNNASFASNYPFLSNANTKL